MSEAPDFAAWWLLGAWLRQTRESLDPRYEGRGDPNRGPRGLTVFAQDRKINRRTAWEIENARRTTFTRATRREIEVAYGLPPYAIDKFLADAQADPDAGRPRYTDPDEDAFAAAEWRKATEANRDKEGAVYTPEEIRGFVEMRVLIRRREQNPGTARNGEQSRIAG